jgi:hypothetical protein
LWALADGSFLGDDEGNFLSLYGKVDDLRIEKKMQDAAKYWAGEQALLGKAVWVPGARQVSDEEAQHQKERLEQGLVPDIAESARRLER